MALVRAHGRSASSFQALTPGLRYWFDATRDACVAYAELGDAWVTVGGGLAADQRELEVMEAFAREARAHGKRVRFFATERELPRDASFEALQIGELPVWDPRDWPNKLSSRMRGQLRRDQKSARVTVRLASQAELADPRGATRRGVDAVIAHWLDTRKVAPMGFMVHVDPWHLAHERRFFVAEHQGSVVATLVAIPVCAREGWFLETMLRLPNAPNGTVELLFDLAMRTFAAEGSPYVTFGMCPLSGVTSKPLQWLRRLTGEFYNYDGLRKFKGKLGPAAWQPVYLVYPKRDLTLLALLDAARAFMPGGVLAFAWNSAIQRATDSARWLAYGSMIWTSAFAWLSQDHWFASAEAKLARVGLDVLTIGGLLLLGKGMRRARALAVSLLTMFTFAASCLQLAAGGAARIEGPLEWTMVAIGTLGSLLTSLFLFAARDRERRYLPDAAAHPSAAISPRLIWNRPTAGDGDL
ncbi:MAG: DUF2156 domain-containing protein [Polyangiales bacterium]